MASDIDYDSFDYNSSQDPFDIDYQIDLFEFRQFVKSKKTKQKIKKSSCPISMKTLKCQPIVVKINCMSYKKTPKAEQKSFRYNRYPQNSELFEFDEVCDEVFGEKSICTQSNVPSNPSKILEPEHLESFSNFRRHFYHVNHQRIKSSLKDHPNIEITNIRVASVNESVQNDFMKTLKQNISYFPQLVYHGTMLNNIESILHYGFLIPNQAHPSNSEAPIIASAHGQSFGNGIYCSRTAVYSLSYVNTTNTLLVCAAIPKRDKVGQIKHYYGNIFVLSDVTRIIPLFFIDFKYLNQSGTNRPWYNKQKELKIDENQEIKKSTVISRKYLRKVLNYMNDDIRKNNQYQIRSFDLFN
ncbi:unnamed protein product [Rotaria sordida]|uniref:PARP catalytic domain-containing protein n=1 Tax=Rotaria sordida TaxID=392033 RepID=A0A814U408_9BILA|nr:unnamed protein product [Rotaria sordida]CAF4107633.1 unnamed protein product [Rotaria sordida]